MKQIIFPLLAFIIALVFIGRISIVFKPIKISFERPLLMVGILLLAISFVLISIDSTRFAKKQILNEIKDYIKESEDKDKVWQNRA